MGSDDRDLLSRQPRYRFVQVAGTALVLRQVRHEGSGGLVTCQRTTWICIFVGTFLFWFLVGYLIAWVIGW